MPLININGTVDWGEYSQTNKQASKQTNSPDSLAAAVPERVACLGLAGHAFQLVLQHPVADAHGNDVDAAVARLSCRLHGCVRVVRLAICRGRKNHNLSVKITNGNGLT